MHIRAIEITASEQIPVGESTQAMGAHRGEVVGIRISDSEGKSIASDVRNDGSLTLDLHAKPRKNEMGLCRILVECLNSLGANWTDLRDVSRITTGSERDIDCQAADGDRLLRMQVTKAEGETSLWNALDHDGQIQARYSGAEIEDALREAVRKKAARTSAAQRAAMILVLDATEFVSHSFPPGVRSFREHYGTWAASLGYQAIWLVGPNPTLTSRLDGQYHST